MEEKVKINWGSFKDTFGGWLNVDILNVRPYIPPEHKFKQWDVRQGLPWLADNSVDLHRISHLVEHLTLDEAKSFLKQIYRTLKPGGLARISTPDARIILKHFFANDMSYFNIEQPSEFAMAKTQGEKLSMLLYSLDYSHRVLFDYDMLKDYLEQAGFRPDRIFRSVAGFSHSEEMQTETQDQHIEISLIVEAVK